MSIVMCPNCGMKVLPREDGTCPSCQFEIGLEEEGVVEEAPALEAEPEVKPIRVPTGMGDLVGLGAVVLGAVLVGVVYAVVDKMKRKS